LKVSQITIYLDPKTESDLKAAVEGSGVSTSRWIAGVIQEKLRKTWPPEVREFLGSWCDLPEIEQIRAAQGTDVTRESL
jgi:hypothetical protein